MDSVAQELLSRIPTGEELIDPKEGDHDNAILKGVSISDDGLALVLTFTGLVDCEGNHFDFDNRVPFPTHQSERWVKNMFLAMLHDIGAVDREDRTARYVETTEVREVVLQMLRVFVGSSYPVSLKERKGFLNLRFRRRKQS